MHWRITFNNGFGIELPEGTNPWRVLADMEQGAMYGGVREMKRIEGWGV